VSALSIKSPANVRTCQCAPNARSIIPYAKWREYDVEDTVRFYSLRLREAGMIKSAPNKIIAQGTDWRFFNELKHELKG
jgi:NitT/TauT family transport system substrate-binding protein